MTTKEADECAKRCDKVMHQGFIYTRISEVGYRYDNNGNRSPFCVLFSRKCNSIVTAKPEDVKYYGPK